MRPETDGKRARGGSGKFESPPSWSSSSGAPLCIDNVNGLQPYEVDMRELHIAGHGYKVMIKRLLRET
jgi:hypothetical protein